MGNLLLKSYRTVRVPYSIEWKTRIIQHVSASSEQSLRYIGQ